MLSYLTSHLELCFTTPAPVPQNFPDGETVNVPLAAPRKSRFWTFGPPPVMLPVPFVIVATYLLFVVSNCFMVKFADKPPPERLAV